MNIWAVGRNYSDHAKELGHAPSEASGPPMIFLKAGSSVVANGDAIHLPSFSKDIHHECEIALRFGSDLKFDAVTVALDLTARDIQTKLKEQAHPWTLAKSFKDSCPLGPWVSVKGHDLSSLKFSLKVGGETRQTGDAKDMVHSIEKMRQYVIECFPVVPGDALLTGTPKGVAAIKPGDVLDAEIIGVVKASWPVAQF